VFKRTFWFGSGVVVGAGGTVWAAVRLRQAAAQVTPGGLADQAITTARRAGSDLRDAVAEGRLVMRETEAQLRAELTPPSLGSGSLDAIEVALVDRRRRGVVALDPAPSRRGDKPGRRSAARR
jgi:hypothetical protein